MRDLSALTFDAFSVCSRLLVSQLLSDKGEYKEAMELLKKALKLEPTTKVRLRVGGGAGVCWGTLHLF